MPENKNLPKMDFSGLPTEKYMTRKFRDIGNTPYETPAYGTGVDPSKYREYLGQGFDVSTQQQLQIESVYKGVNLFIAAPKTGDVSDMQY